MYDTLLDLPLLQGLGRADLTNILEKVKFHFDKYTPGQPITAQGDKCDKLIFILKGRIRSELTDKENRYALDEFIDAPHVIEPYSLFGMVTNYSSSYYADTDVSCVTIKKEYILTELNKYNIFQLNYLNIISNRAQSLHNRLLHTHVGDTREKRIHFLQQRCLNPSGEKYLHIRMEDFAILIDDTRLNVSRALNNLQDRGLVALSRGEIHIPDLEKLSKYKV